MRFGSLFAGIGGMDLGLERAGMTCSWQVEWDPWCREVLAKHWPSVTRYGDITEVDPNELEPVDLVAGGFPCQPHSLAGERKADEDDRDLWGEFVRVLRGVQPRWVLAENVPGLLSSRLAGVRGGFFGKVLRDLAELGFDVRWASLPASAFGAPHIRWRVFLVAHAHGQPGRFESIALPWREAPALAGQHGTPGALADADSERCPEQHVPAQPGWAGEPDRCGDVGDTDSPREPQPPRRLLQEWGRPGDSCWWRVEPGVGRVAHGVPLRVDRLGGLVNAIVPHKSEFFGRLILAADQT